MWFSLIEVRTGVLIKSNELFIKDCNSLADKNLLFSFQQFTNTIFSLPLYTYTVDENVIGVPNCDRNIGLYSIAPNLVIDLTTLLIYSLKGKATRHEIFSLLHLRARKSDNFRESK